MKLKGYRGELYFHVVEDDRRLGFGDGRLVEPGVELKAKDEQKRIGNRLRSRKVPVECSFGMHGCSNWQDLRDNIFPSHGRWVCLVRLNTRLRNFSTRHAALRRKVVAMRRVGYSFAYSGFLSRDARSEDVAQWILEKPYKGIK